MAQIDQLNEQLARPQPPRRSTGTGPVGPLNPVLQVTFAALSAAGVRWCLLRPPRSLHEPTGDLDLLIHPDDRRHVALTLESIGYAPFPMQRNGSESMFLQYDARTGCWLRLHVVSELAFGRTRTLRTNMATHLLDRRLLVGQLAQPAPDDAFWALLLHCLLDKHRIADRHRPALSQAATLAQADGPLGRCTASICPNGWTPQRIIACVRNGDWDTLERTAPRLLQRTRRLQPIRLRLSQGFRHAMSFCGRLRARLRRRGVSVAILGPDGAGKSTLARNVARHFFTDARVLYMGSGTAPNHPRVPLAFRLRVPGLGAPGRVFLLWGRWLAGLAHRWRGRLVLFDRYPYDALVRQREGVPLLYRLSLWVQAHVCPRPHLILLLDAPGELMYRRKREWDPQALEAKRNDFRAMLANLHELRILDATRDEEQLCRDAIKQIWRVYVSRWQGERRCAAPAGDEPPSPPTKA